MERLVELITNFQDNNTSRIRILNTFNPFCLELLMQSVLFQDQIQREFTQTAQPKISNLIIEKNIFLLIFQQIQTKIATLVQKSFKDGKQSKALLEIGKAAVESAIEEGEEFSLKGIL